MCCMGQSSCVGISLDRIVNETGVSNTDKILKYSRTLVEEMTVFSNLRHSVCVKIIVRPAPGGKAVAQVLERRCCDA
jgi:hypothetical protein